MTKEEWEGEVGTDLFQNEALAFKPHPLIPFHTKRDVKWKLGKREESCLPFPALFPVLIR